MFLALDSSTLTLSLALVERRDGELRVLDAFTEGPPRKQSEMLPGVIGELLSRNRVELRQLEGIAVGLGPGSFTGLRIGLATVKALAYAAKLPVAGVSSLAAVALEGPAGRRLRPIAVARQGELYVGAYRREESALEALEPEQAMSPAELAPAIAGSPESLVLGPAAREYREALVSAGTPPERIQIGPEFPSAAAVARLARFDAPFDLQALFALEPHYVRPSEAERNPKFPPLPGPAPTARLRED